MKKSIASILAILSITIYAGVNDIPNDGTSLLDDLTSMSRVVVDAFLNSSNRVYDLIESVSPRTSLEPATNYTDQVDIRLRGELTEGAFVPRRASSAQIAEGLIDGSNYRSAAEIFSQLDGVYGTVSNIVRDISTESISYGDWVITTDEGDFEDGHVAYNQNGWYVYIDNPDPEGERIIVANPSGDESSYYLMWKDDNWAYGSEYGALTISRGNTNCLGLATLYNLSSATSTIYRYMYDIGITNFVTYTNRHGVTIGTRRIGSNIGENSLAHGRFVQASGDNSFVSGDNSIASQWATVAMGLTAYATNLYSFTWSGVPSSHYGSHGSRTFNINPQNGAFGLYIGDKNLYDIFSEWISNNYGHTIETVEISADMSETNTVTRSYAPLDIVTHSELSDALGDIDLTDYAKKDSLDALRSTVIDISNESAVITRLYTSSNVIDEITNYNSVVHLPSRRMYQLTDTNTYMKVWDEMVQHSNTLSNAKAYTDASVAALPSTYAPRAWSRTTSGLGADAPANTTWISTPTTVIAGGLEYAKVVHSGGALWVLSGNGMVDFTPNTNAYLRITAEDGTEIFSIEKTDAVTVGADSSGITIENGTISIPVPVVSTEHPVAYYRQTLDAGDWAESPGTWSGASGSWVFTRTFSTLPSSGFFRFTYEMPGNTLIKNSAAIDVSAGIMCTDGIHKVRPVYNNGNITWEVVQ